MKLLTDSNGLQPASLHIAVADYCKQSMKPKAMIIRDTSRHGAHRNRKHNADSSRQGSSNTRQELIESFVNGHKSALTCTGWQTS